MEHGGKKQRMEDRYTDAVPNRRSQHLLLIVSEVQQQRRNSIICTTGEQVKRVYQTWLPQ